MAAKPLFSFFNQTKNVLVAGRVIPATTYLARLKGLLGTKSLEPDQGLYLNPCSGIHMIGMKYPIDAIFFDQNLKVVGVESDIPIGKMLVQFAGAKSCLELKAGSIKDSGTEVGDLFLVETHK